MTGGSLRAPRRMYKGWAPYLFFAPFLLLTAVFTEDLRRGLRFAEAVRSGWVNVNASTNYWESHLPFGGRAGSLSGRGRVGGATVLEQLSELKTIVYPA